jgi:hypothetical protein
MAEVVASAKIVAVARRKLARIRARKARNWKTFNALDNNDEQKHLRRRERMVGAGGPVSLLIREQSGLRKKYSQEDLKGLVPPATYTGALPAALCVAAPRALLGSRGVPLLMWMLGLQFSVAVASRRVLPPPRAP